MDISIVRRCSDVEKTKAFYTGVLGFAADHDGQFVTLRKPGLDWHIELAPMDSAQETSDQNIVNYVSGKKEYDAILASAAISGIQVSEPKDAFWKGSSMVIADPDGHEIIVSSRGTQRELKIVGVPEHFNYPWQLCFVEGAFEKRGLNLSWTDVPEGTGKMCKMLRDGEADIAVILTEGIVKDINDGNPSKIVQQYVGSPLIWGIHVAANSAFNNLSDLDGKTVAISRVGSGSQLMAYVNAAAEGWDSSKLKFEIVNTIDGAVDALSEGRADYFMWERFMTKPLCDAGIFRRIADRPTPWPCFVIAVRNELLESNPELIRSVLEIINAKTAGFKEIPQIASEIASKFNQQQTDIETWLSLTEWSSGPVTPDLLNNVQNQLLALSLIDKKGNFADMVHTF